MARLASRLTSTGNLLTRGELNEVAGTTIRLTINNQYAAFFDEIDLQGATDVAKRETNTGTILISGYFDEVTLSPNITTGQQAYTTTGTHSWTCPSGVFSVSVVCIGGGGGGGRFDYSYASGAGGGLGWRNNISVTPGQSYTVVVGGGGASGIPVGEQAGQNGGDSYFISTGTVAGFGGTRGNGSYGYGNQAGGGYVGQGGGTGGRGQAGAGGAGGYTGNGGDGWVYDAVGTQNLPSGGAGAGAGVTFGDTLSNGGGGVGIYGQTATATTASQGGSGGSTGGSFYYGISGSYVNGGVGGSFGGGGGGGNNSSTKGGNGAGGAVRIIWGDGREFPSIDTEDL